MEISKDLSFLLFSTIFVFNWLNALKQSCNFGAGVVWCIFNMASQGFLEMPFFAVYAKMVLSMRLQVSRWHTSGFLSLSGAFPELALLSLDGLGTSSPPKLRLQLDHTGANGVSFPTGLVALGPLRPLWDHAVNSFKQKKKHMIN